VDSDIEIREMSMARSSRRILSGLRFSDVKGMGITIID